MRGWEDERMRGWEDERMREVKSSDNSDWFFNKKNKNKNKKEIIRSKGLENITAEELVAEMKPKGRSTILFFIFLYYVCITMQPPHPQKQVKYLPLSKRNFWGESAGSLQTMLLERAPHRGVWAGNDELLLFCVLSLSLSLSLLFSLSLMQQKWLIIKQCL